MGRVNDVSVGARRTQVLSSWPVVVISFGLVVLAAVAPVTALVSGPAMLLIGTAGIRRARPGPVPLDLLFMAVAGSLLCVIIVVVAVTLLPVRLDAEYSG